MLSSALVDSEPSLPLPPPPPPPPLKALATEALSNSSATSAPSSFSYSPSLLIIAGILAVVVLASASIHLLLRFFAHRASHSSPPPLVHPRSSSASAASAASQAPERREREKEREAQIAALPVFTLASAAPKSSGDCAVCLSRFRPHDSLRLLPACRHAFHASCVDAWLRSTPSCPLCRASIISPAPPPPPPPLLAEEAERSESFRVEIGSVSRRRSGADAPPPPHGRSYSLGSAFDFLVEEEVEAVVARALRRPSTKERKPPEANDGGGADAPAPPGAELAEAVGERGGSWLRDYVDRLASSASSSFSSLRFSSRRFDAAAAAAPSGGESWDLEANQIRTTTAEVEESAYSALYRWLIGVSS